MTTTNDIDATRDWTGRIDDKTIVERTAQAVALRHIGLLTAFDGIDTADELYEQAETAERYDISKALEASNDTAEIQAVRERLGQIVEQIRTGLPAAAEVEKARAERDEYAHDNNRLVAELVKVRAQLTDANRALDGYKADERSLTAANTALANERDRLRHALLDLAKSSGKTHVWDHEQTDWVPVAQFAAAKAEVAS